MTMNPSVGAPVQHLDRLGRHLGIELYAQRDDLLPFPLAGNKARKLHAELKGFRAVPSILVTNGAVDSNHCRTTAWMAAELGVQSHLVLHGRSEGHATSLRLLDALGATYTIVHPDDIASAIAEAVRRAHLAGGTPHVIPGGGHSPRGARVYRRVGRRVLRTVGADVTFVASGTGATHGGLTAAAELEGERTRVVGVSVARQAERGVAAVAEAAAWAGAPNATIEFWDDYRAGGYGLSDERIDEAVALGWRFGLPLDATYTGKAFAALIDHARANRRSRVLFWHTGGLWNFVVQGGT